MKLNIKPLLCGEKTVLDFRFSLSFDYTEAGFTFPEDATVEGSIRDAGGYMLLEALCSVKYNAHCARCLTPVSGVQELRFRRCVTTKLEQEDETDEYLLVSQDCVELDEPIREELLLSLPLRVLCQEDCRGLCPKCGKNLNEGECGCVLKEPDPRWAKLKAFTEGT